MITRRDVLRSSALLSLAPVLPGFLARTAAAVEAGRDGRVLVVLQLDGGNDGINTVVPFGDEAYARHRRALRLPADKILKIGDGVGLHPAMKPAAELLESDRLAIVQGVGYPNPNRSHFQSMAIWQTARPGKPEPSDLGWLGNALDLAKTGTSAAAVHVGDENLPRALIARRAVSTSLADASDLALSLPQPRRDGSGIDLDRDDDLTAFVARTVTGAYTTAAELEAAAERSGKTGVNYPASALSQRLALVARSLKAGAPARVYYVIQPGYDSHSLQLPVQARLLRELAGSIRAFLDDLAAAKLADRVLLMAFSEFGRRPEENGSLGTDHGTAGPVFLAGAKVKPGLAGPTPLLGDLADGDLKWSIDFRQIYATVLDRWLGVNSETILGGRFETLPVLNV